MKQTPNTQGRTAKRKTKPYLGKNSMKQKPNTQGTTAKRKNKTVSREEQHEIKA